jgi:hypothetical protein
MELLWAITKMIQYLVLGPVWWISTYLASFFYPLEGDSNQDILALIFSTILVIAIGFGLTVWLQTE